MKDNKEKPKVLMTRPDGQPAMVPAELVNKMLDRGFKRGYRKPKNANK